MDIAEKPEIDLEETPQSRQRKKQAAERKERKASVKVAKTWYEQVGNKITKKTLTSNGNMHTTFVCDVSKKNAELIESLGIKGKKTKTL